MPELSSGLTLAVLQETVGGQLLGNRDAPISGASSLDDAGPEDISYVVGDRYREVAVRSKAGAFIVKQAIPELNRPQLVVPHPAYTFVQVIGRFFPRPPRPRGISTPVWTGTEVSLGPAPSIGPFVTLGNRVRIGARATLYAGVCIGDDVVIGDDCTLYPHVTILDGCHLGNRVIIHAGTVVGSDGFGYVQHEGRHHKIPQRGIVIIEDDVELGANVTVDRATFGQTVLKHGTKVDNLVQIAHNVQIGPHSIVVAQVGIAGSSTVGESVVIGGQAGVADHVTIGDRAMVAARSGVARPVEPGRIVSGNPAIAHDVSLRAHALIPHLPEFRTALRELTERLDALERAAAPSAAKGRGSRAPKKR